MLKRIKKIAMEQLTQGVSPRGLAFSLAVAVVFATFPLLGFTTLLCFLFGLLFRLNHPLVQIINYLMTPIHLLLIPVFLRMGEKFFGAAPMPFSIPELLGEFSRSPLHFIEKFGREGGMAVCAWMAIAPIVGLIIYYLTKPIFERMALVVIKKGS